MVGRVVVASRGGRGGTSACELRVDGDADVTDEVLVAAPLVVEGGPSDVAAAVKRVGDGGLAELLLLDTAVADKGAEDKGVCGGRGKDELDRGEEGTVLLAAALLDDVGNAVEGNTDDAKAEGEEEGELDLVLDRHAAAQDDGDGEEDEEQVGEDVARGRGDELGVALAAAGAGVREDLPVVGKGTAFGQVAYDDGGKGEEEEPADDDKGAVVGAFPGDVGEATEEFEDCVFEGPEAEGKQLAAIQRRAHTGHRRDRDIRCCVKDAAEEDEATGNLSATEVICGQIYAAQVDIVGAVDEDVVDATHAQEERHEGSSGDAVLGKEALGADEATDEAQDDDAGAQGRGPPADEEGGLVVAEVAIVGGIRVDGHGGGQSQPVEATTVCVSSVWCDISWSGGDAGPKAGQDVVSTPRTGRLWLALGQQHQRTDTVAPGRAHAEGSRRAREAVGCGVGGRWVVD